METAKMLPVMETLQAAMLAYRKRKGTWKALVAFSRLITSSQRISEVLGIVKATNATALIIQKPDTILKWSGKYLAKNLVPSQRSRMLAFHYHFIATRIHDAFYACLLSDGFVLWSFKTDAGEIVLHMRYAQSPREGDLSLIMTFEHATIYELSFTIVPGEFVHAPGPVLLVARVQGRRNRFEAIKKATKLCCDVSPPYVLMAAIEAIGAALGVGCVAGVSNVNQIYGHKSFDYGSFWQTLSFEKAGFDFYASALPIASRPLDQCSPDHRRRTKKKRNFKAGIRMSVQRSFECQCLKESSTVGPELYGLFPDEDEMAAVVG
jgi:uncharacterized protein VirK/YbjX